MYLGKDFNNIGHSFQLSEIGSMKEDTLTIRSNNFFKSINRLAGKTLNIHEIINDFNFLFNYKKLVGFVTKVIRYGRNPITFIYRKSNNRSIGFISPYQGYVCSVQRGDNRNVFTLFFQDLFCHISSGSMGNGIMHM